MIYVPESFEKEAVRACLRERIKTLEEVLELITVDNDAIYELLDKAREELREYR
jgi:hypothetical protein